MATADELYGEYGIDLRLTLKRQEDGLLETMERLGAYAGADLGEAAAQARAEAADMEIDPEMQAESDKIRLFIQPGQLTLAGGGMEDAMPLSPFAPNGDHSWKALAETEMGEVTVALTLCGDVLYIEADGLDIGEYVFVRK